MNKTTVSILGCGWLGLPLAKRLKENGHSIKGSVSRDERLKKINKVCDHAIALDITGSIPVDDEFWDSEVMIITIPPFGDPKTYHESIERLIEVLATKDYRQVIYTSSTSVYPNLNRRVTEEDASEDALSRSGISLLAIEKQLQANLPNFCSIRFGGLFGPGRHPVNYLSGRLLTGSEDPVNLIHLDDCLGIYLRLIEKPATNTTFNACHPDHPTKKEYYTAAAKKLGIEAPKFEQPSQGYKEVSVEKLIKETGYEFGDKLQLT